MCPCLAPRHSGSDAFSRAIIFLIRSVTKYFSLTLKITASVLPGAYEPPEGRKERPTAAFESERL